MCDPVVGWALGRNIWKVAEITEHSGLKWCRSRHGVQILKAKAGARLYYFTSLFLIKTPQIPQENKLQKKVCKKKKKSFLLSSTLWSLTKRKAVVHQAGIKLGLEDLKLEPVQDFEGWNLVLQYLTGRKTLKRRQNMTVPFQRRFESLLYLFFDLERWVYML